MAYQKTIYSGLVILLLFAGCGLKEGVVQKEPKSFLWFTGNTQDAIVYIDDLSPIILYENRSSTGAEGEMNTKKSNKIFSCQQVPMECFLFLLLVVSL